MSTFMFHVFLLSLLYTSRCESTLQTERSEGFRIERIGHNGEKANFTWIRREGLSSWFEAAKLCSELNAYLPRANEMRYFYKTLRSDDVNLPLGNLTEAGVVFYLADVLEATMDYPSGESGERMCLAVEKRPNSQLHLAESSAIRSCLTPANLLVCKSNVDGTTSSESRDASNIHLSLCDPIDERSLGPHPQWILDLKKKAEIGQDHVCIPKVWFYLAIGFGVLLVLSLSILAVSCACRYRSLIGQKRTINLGAGEETLWDSTIDKAPHASGRLVSDVGKMDILADSSFSRAVGSFSKNSYKEALVNSGYQRLSNGKARALRKENMTPLPHLRASNSHPDRN